MCGRFTREYTWEQVHAFLQPLTIERTGSNLQPSYNICPTQTVDTIVLRDGKAALMPMRWGLIPAWWKKPLKELPATFNARAETVADKPVFRSGWRRQRCVIPASGYYEWRTEPDGKQPHYFSRRDGGLIGIAGIWDLWKNPETGEDLHSCSMIITEANALVAPIHNRMPVILESEQLEHWLAVKAGTEVLRPAAEGLLQEWPVSRRVNSSRADPGDHTLITPV